MPLELPEPGAVAAVVVEVRVVREPHRPAPMVRIKRWILQMTPLQPRLVLAEAVVDEGR